MSKQIMAIAEKDLKKIEKILYRAAQEIMTESKGLVPVDIGNLKSTGHVSNPITVGGRVNIQLGYNADYALRQHEDQTLRHTVGQAKYLEIPFRNRVKNLDAEIIEALKK